jgi:hypothetical protein
MFATIQDALEHIRVANKSGRANSMTLPTGILTSFDSLKMWLADPII